MKSSTVRFKRLLSLAAALSLGTAAVAQSLTSLPVCSGSGAGNVYYNSQTDSIFRLNPLSPGTSISTGIAMPAGAKSLAVSRNLNGGSTNPTYYTTVPGGPTGGFRYISYWDAPTLTWFTTLNSLPGDQISGGGGFLFGLDTVSGNVFRSSGTGGPSIVATVGAINSGPKDIATDCSGNFYVMNEAGPQAPKTGTIGTATTLTGDTTSPTAFNNKNAQYKMQSIYTAAELVAQGLSAGYFTSIAFNTTTLGDTDRNANFMVSMAQTTASVASTSFAAGLTNVFAPSMYIHTASGLQTINFTTPFLWDGASNIVVEVSYNGKNDTNNSRTYFSTTASPLVVFDTTGSGVGVTSNRRLNTTFGLTPIPILKKYSSAGTLLKQYLVLSSPSTGGNGLTVNGNNVFYDGADGKLYSGVLGSPVDTFSFTASSASPFAAQPVRDFASCGFAGVGGTVAGRDTIKSCNGANNIQLTATGPGPYNWTVISGTATITGSGNTVSVTTPNTAVLTVNDADCSGANTLVDTVVIFVANASVDAGPDFILGGCNNDFTDTLIAHVTNTTPGISYQYSWTPLLDIFTGQNDTVVIIRPRPGQDSVVYVFEATTIGGCSFKDTVVVTLIDSTPRAQFSFSIKNGCDFDTVQFVNLSSPARLIDSVAWNFGDGTFTDEISPRHIYNYQAYFPVFLLVKNGKCFDTVRRFVNIEHPIEAEFTVDDSTVCTGTIVKFKNVSNANFNPTFTYIFGDGTTSNLANPTHAFKNPGSYNVALALKNTLGCVDTFRKLIVIDSVPYVRFASLDSVICEGQALRFQGDFLQENSTGTTVDLGDGTVFQNANSFTYAFDKAGTYVVKYTARYRICPDTTDSATIIVRPFPGANLGPDTVLCPNGAPVVLTDRNNAGNSGARFKWNTGETTAAIFARDNGTYWVNTTVDGCTNTDSILVAKDCYIDIPNAFTPGGANPYFLPRQSLSRSLNAFKMTIYNRWGQIMYETTGTTGRGWDGKFNGNDQPQGVYIYMIDVTFDNGVKEHYTGNLTLLR